MRKPTDDIATISIADLATVTGGCKKRGVQAPVCHCGSGGGGEVDVSVSAGGAQPQGGQQPPALI